MKSFKRIINESKMSYDQAYDIHMSEIKFLSSEGFEVRASNKQTNDISKYGYAKSFSLNLYNGELRTYDIWISFEHNNITRINGKVTTLIAKTDGDNEYIDTPKKVDEMTHKNIKTAIKYVNKKALEYIQEDFAIALRTISNRSIDYIKTNGLFSILYRMKRYTNVGNEKDAIRFIEKMSKINLANYDNALALSKKLIKKL